MHQRGLLSIISRLVKDKEKFFSHQDFINKYNPIAVFLQYFQIIIAVISLNTLERKQRKLLLTKVNLKNNDFLPDSKYFHRLIWKLKVKTS